MNTSYKIGFKQIGIDLSDIRRNRSTCPNCSHTRKKSKDRCLWVDLKHGNYFCHHCGFMGRVDSDEWIQGKNEREIKRVTFYNPTTSNEQKSYSRPNDNYKSISLSARKYLNDRGISDKTIDRNKVTSKGHPNGEQIAFRYYFDDVLRRVKYRGIEDKSFYQEPNCKPILYKLDDIIDAETCIITEGEIDALSFEEIGLTNAVSLDSGAASEGQSVDGKFKCIGMSSRYLEDKRVIYIAMDSDAPGKYTATKLADRLGVDRCLIIHYPEDCKDANDVLCKHGKEALLECFNKAKPTRIRDVEFFDDSYDELMRILEDGEDMAENCHVANIDENFSWIPGFMYLFTGYANHGKSEFLRYLMVVKSAMDGDKWAVFSPEHAPAHDFFREVVQTLTGKYLRKGASNCVTKAELEACREFINEHFIFIYPKDDVHSKEEALHSPEWILSKIREVSLLHGITGVVIDPWNQLDHIMQGFSREDLYLSHWLKQCKRTAQNHNLKFVIVAHPTAGEGRARMRPTMYSLSGGAMWANKMDAVVIVHRPQFWQDKSDRSVEITIEKAKKQYLFGRPDTKTFRYSNFRYEDPNFKDSEMEGIYRKLTIENPVNNHQSMQEARENYIEDDIPF